MGFMWEQLHRLNAWFDEQGETVRLILFMLLTTVGLFSLTIGVNTKNRWLLLLGVLAFVPIVAPACQRAAELGYKSTMYVVALFLGVVIASALILSIF